MYVGGWPRAMRCRCPQVNDFGLLCSPLCDRGMPARVSCVPWSSCLRCFVGVERAPRAVELLYICMIYAAVFEYIMWTVLMRRSLGLFPFMMRVTRFDRLFVVF